MRVGLARAVVPDDEEAFVVSRVLELELWKHHRREPLSHLLRNNICSDESFCRADFIGSLELNNRLGESNWIRSPYCITPAFCRCAVPCDPLPMASHEIRVGQDAVVRAD